jgi:serine phosphatase RsbU (regulator of sigma subunit)
MPDARLKVTDAQGRRFVPLQKELFTIGRRTAADLQIASTDVSRDHAEILNNGKQYILRDLGSRYGTFVNGEQVTERTLLSGDRIRLGRTESVELVFQGTGEPASGLRDSLRDTAANDVTDLRQMAGILNGLRALGSGRVLGEVLTLVMDAAIEVTKAERGFVMLANDHGELEYKVARGRGGLTLAGTSFNISAKIPRQVYSTGKPFSARDLMEDNLIAAAHDGTIAIGIRCVLCVPLRVVPFGNMGEALQERVIGVLYVDSRERSVLYSPTTMESLEVVGTQAALAIESARLYAEAAEKGRIERELRVAADIQRALLADPAYEGRFCDLMACSIPCRTVGGDFFDYLELGDGSFAFALGDVAGKGAPAALQAAAVQTNFAALAPVGADPAETMVKINAALLRRAVDARFATMFYGKLKADGDLCYSNAGQEPPMLVRRDGEVLLLETGGPVIGLLSGVAYDSAVVTMQPGDVVVVCSDGVTEARSVEGEEFGRDRAIEAVRKGHGQKPDVVMDSLTAVMREFVGIAPQADDITVLVLRYLGPPRS